MIKIDWFKDIKTHKEINYLNISNVLSAIRFTLVPLLIAMFSITQETGGEVKKIKMLIAVFAGIICFTDLFDGFLARRLNEVTKIGMVLDPVGDFLMITSFSIMIFQKNMISWWFFLLIMIRIPGLLSAILYFLIFDIKFKIKTSILGKATIFFLMSVLGLAAIILFFENIPDYFNNLMFYIQIFGSILLIISIIEKVLHFIKFLKIRKRAEHINENIQI